MYYQSRKTGNAYGLLLLLVIVVVGFVFYVGGDPLDLFRNKIKTDPSGQLLPWNEQKRLIAKDSKVQPPSSSQVAIEEYIQFKGEPQDSNQARGEIDFVVDNEGRVSGNWTGNFYESPDLSFSILSCEFKGNIDPAKIYSDASGQDPSKLFVIAKGGYIMLGDDRKTGNAPQRRGAIYLTGWIDTNRVFTGKVITTPDKQEYKLYPVRASGMLPEDIREQARINSRPY